MKHRKGRKSAMRRKATPGSDQFEAEIAELERLAYEGMIRSMIGFLENYHSMAAEWGVELVTMTSSGNMTADVLSMHRALHTMSAGVLAVADARPAVTN